MSTTLKNLQPTQLWNYFAELNAVPRGSKKEKRVIEFIKHFGNSLGLETSVDEVGNVIIKKPASPGMEKATTIVLQSHLDMVHQKNAGTNFNFDSQGIEMLVEGDWVKANGTTLGADNGIGVATIMAVLASKTIQHPAIEALFTIDEETGMTGALNLKGGLLDAGILLNLDTEDDNVLTIGCAGGIDVTAAASYTQEDADPQANAFRITLNGLTGGHSGMDIHLGRGNANKLMNRLLLQASEQFAIGISSIDGGSLRNAIPRESVAVVITEQKLAAAFSSFISEQMQVLKTEYHTTDPNLKLGIEAIGTPKKVFALSFQNKILRAMYACPNGIYRMSPDIEGLVQTSNNIARVQITEGALSIQCLARSSVNTEKMDLANAIKSTFELADATVSFAGSYPGWAPKPEAAIVKLMSSLYQDRYKEKVLVSAIHAGLECGILGANYPDMEMVSFGPNIRGAHSPDEKVQISSVQKYWEFLLESLKRIPAKN